MKQLESIAQNSAPTISNKVYDVLKRLVTIVLPALGSLYFGLAQIWGLPAAEEIVGTLAVIAMFLGTLIGVSTYKYNNSDAPYDGEIIVTEDDSGKKLFTLSVDDNPMNIIGKESVRFRIQARDVGYNPSPPRPPQ